MLQRFQCFEDPVRPRVHPDGGQVAPSDDAFAIDHEQGSLSETVLIAIDAVLSRDGTLGLEVTQQREVEMARVPEGCIS